MPPEHFAFCISLISSSKHFSKATEVPARVVCPSQMKYTHPPNRYEPGPWRRTVFPSNNFQLIFSCPHRHRPGVESHPSAYQQPRNEPTETQGHTEEQEAQKHREDHLKAEWTWQTFLYTCYLGVVGKCVGKWWNAHGACSMHDYLCVCVQMCSQRVRWRERER